MQLQLGQADGVLLNWSLGGLTTNMRNPHRCGWQTPRRCEGTLAEAHELEERDEGGGKQLARLGAAGRAVQLHLHYSVLDGHLRNQRQFQVPGQGSILISALQRACVLLVAHVHLLHQQ